MSDKAAPGRGLTDLDDEVVGMDDVFITRILNNAFLKLFILVLGVAAIWWRTEREGDDGAWLVEAGKRGSELECLNKRTGMLASI